MTDTIVTITPTIMDGTVLRWYPSLAAAEDDRAIASASRNKVEFYTDDVPPRIRDAAQAAHRELSANRNADVRHYATHQHEAMFGPLVPVRGTETS